ncbi:MAG: proline dehydrogenase family protein [Beutenbergiaceae bacterium]
MVTTTAADVVDEARALGIRWVEQTVQHQRGSERRATERLAQIVADPAGMDFLVRFLDRVARPSDAAVAAAQMRGLADHPGADKVLSAADRAMLGVGGPMAKVAPASVSPARRRLRQLLGHLVVEGTDQEIDKQLAGVRADGYRINLALLGEAAIGQAQAAAHGDRLWALCQRTGVHQVSLKLSALLPQISPWDVAGTIDRAVARLQPLYAAAAAAQQPTSITLDLEEYRLLEPVVGAFEALLGESELALPELGIAVPAYLPQSQAILERLIGLAQSRVAAGGSRIRIRLVKGAHLATEMVDSEIHGWPQAPLLTKAEVDANFVRLLETALQPAVCAAVQFSIGSHNLFDIALGYILARRRGVEQALEVDMLYGMAPAQLRAIHEVGASSAVNVYTPVIESGDYCSGIGYLMRRLQELGGAENFLRAQHGGAPRAMEQQQTRLGEAVAASAQQPAAVRRDGRRRESGEHFVNTPDSDPTAALVRERVRKAMDRQIQAPVAAMADSEGIDAAVEVARTTAAEWGVRSGSDRARVLRAAARGLEVVRTDLIAALVHEVGKPAHEADAEVTEAVDFARYYADQAKELDNLALSEGLQAQPGQVVVVAAPWNVPVTTAVAGATAALAAGAAALVKPAPRTPRSVEIAVDAIRTGLAHAGADPDAVQLTRTDDETVGKALVAHDGVDTVLLTGSAQTAQRFSRWRAHRSQGPRVFAQTSGKNAMVVTASADFDQAIADVLSSAFGYSGQKCSAASLLILVGSVATSERFRERLIDAVSTLKVGAPSDMGAAMGPLIEPASGKLADALSQLQHGEQWLVEPAQLDDDGRLWSPGVKVGVAPGSSFHVTECFGPVLGIMSAADLDQAIAWQNATGYGLAGSIHSLDDAEVSRWIDEVHIGNAYVNRPTTGARVGRHPLGGWKRSVVGPGAKVGGPQFLPQLVTWQQQAKPTVTAEVGPRVGAVVEAVKPWLADTDWQWLAQAAQSDAHARDRYAAEDDPSGLAAESNVLRYRPLSQIQLRAGREVKPVSLLRVLIAAECAGVPATVSIDPSVDLGDAMDSWARGEGWLWESDEDIATRVADGQLRGRVRVLGDASQLWAASIEPQAHVRLIVGEVLTSGNRELMSMLREQVVSSTEHRYGYLASTVLTRS